MASHGGFVGVILALFWFARRHQCGFPLFGGCLGYGDADWSAPWAHCQFHQRRTLGAGNRLPLRSDFSGQSGSLRCGDGLLWPVAETSFAVLYEAALEEPCFWPTHSGVLALPHARGQIGGEFLLGYGIVRVIGEMFREPDADLIFHLSRGQFYSLFLIVAGVLVIRLARRRDRSSNPTPA